MPKVDERHKDISQQVTNIARVCLSPEFLTLKRELERAYKRYGADQAASMAFQDALYTMLVQDDIQFWDCNIY